jgi:hypothetical protein
MRRTIVLLALALVVLGTATAQASSVHFKPKGQPEFEDLGLTLQATGVLAGLGNVDLVVSVTAVGQPIATCTNPSGANQPPGQNPAEVELGGSQEISADEIKNGSVKFAVTTGAPVTPIPGAPDCPNRKWTETIVDVVFSSATITIEQPAGTVVLGPSTFVL